MIFDLNRWKISDINRFSIYRKIQYYFTFFLLFLLCNHTTTTIVTNILYITLFECCACIVISFPFLLFIYLFIFRLALLPKSALTAEEEAWNAYPYTKTRYTCPFVEKFSIEIETYYYPDNGYQENVFNLDGSDLRNREVGMCSFFYFNQKKKSSYTTMVSYILFIDLFSM